MRKGLQQGFTLIELIAFVVLIGIIAGGLLVGLNESLSRANTPTSITQASFLANARMQIILMNRSINGYTTLSDPCTTSPGLAICTPLSTYAAANNFTVSTPIISGTNPKIITITVSGAGDAIIKAYVYNYANN
ncbi:type II secretion system protein [Legionella bononiensis]|uniref:Type II secretion system protein n=1 Tax=Legionella bononiensis TaxID=2793102 RepID=A0ABS1WBE2_9GAMM|nr:type II secretion system protein [Legionella bononiensis]MBL7480969.1 type II secretion system protein [Legionella bononiensis]MBL7526677.1 type II secretion system protein [Legionella bononiensis]MBL7564084.1 type II secretion system protein [Legionella bononiensis]